MKKLIAAAGMGTALLVGAAVGPSVGSAQESEPTEAPEFVPPFGAEGRPTPYVDAIDGLVEDGTLTQAQADAVLEALAEARPEGHRGPKGDRGPMGDSGPRQAFMNMVESAGDVLGLTPEEMRTAHREGSTLAEMAASQGVAADDLIDSLVETGSADLAEAAADGKIDQKKADEISATMEERVTSIVNGEFGGHRGG